MTSPTLLIVDDEPDLGQVIKEMMQTYGFRGEAVTSVDEAMTRLDQAAFDLVLSDVRMPIADGIELVERLSDGRLPRLHVALMSGFLDISLPEALDRGAFALFQKPLKFDDLATILKHQLLPPAERWRGSGPAPARRLEKALPTLADARAQSLFEPGRGGFFLAGPEFGLKPGEDVAFDLQFGGAERLTGTGRVVWNRDVARSVYGAGCGVQFLSLDASSLGLLPKLMGQGFLKAVVPLGIPAQYR